MIRYRAQATVEFALAVPLLLILLLGLFEFSRLLFTYVSLTNGAREMTRVAAVARASNSAVIAGFNSYTIIPGGINAATDQVAVTVADEACVSDERQGRACAAASRVNVACPLPLQTTCALPARVGAGGGYVQVDVTYRFEFLQIASMPGISTLKTSARAYVE